MTAERMYSSDCSFCGDAGCYYGGDVVVAVVDSVEPVSLPLDAGRA